MFELLYEHYVKFENIEYYNSILKIPQLDLSNPFVLENLKAITNKVVHKLQSFSGNIQLSKEIQEYRVQLENLKHIPLTIVLQTVGESNFNLFFTNLLEKKQQSTDTTRTFNLFRSLYKKRSRSR
ncbi:MAG: hypothetical protein HON90_01635 [Halobacteriovoraceae bacterium]|nr:hypothetical protein [Halobacteriovoraceae bacterium]